MLSIYVPVRNALRLDGNIDDQERMHILTSYKTCMMKSFKENVSQAAKMRNNLKDTLLKGLILSTNSEMDKNKDKLDLVQSNSTYYLLGYVLHTRKDQINCECCFDSLTTEQNELPNDFYAAYITKLKSQGFLRFASLGMYYTFARLRNSFKITSRQKVIKGVATNKKGEFPKSAVNLIENLCFLF